MARHVVGVIAGTAAVAVSLGGCLLPIDSSGANVLYANESSQDVVVMIEGLGDDLPTPVASKGSYLENLPKCVGTGIRVEAKSGELIGRIDKQACPNWTLTINEDGTLDYVEDE